MRNKWILLAALGLLTGCSDLPSWMGGTPPEKPKLPGERFEVLPPVQGLQPDETLKNVAVNLPPAVENTDWAQHRQPSGNLALKGMGSTRSATIGEGDDFAHPLVPRPVVGGGAVFAMDATGHISAHDAANIETIRWQSDGLAEKGEPDVIGGGLAYDNDRLYAVSGRGAVAAFEAQSGKLLWRKTLKNPLRSAPKVAGDTLLAVTIDNQIYAFSAATGEIAWTQRGIDETTGLMNSVSPAVASNGAVIVPYSSGDIYALSLADGREGWRESLVVPGGQSGSVFSGVGGDPVVDDQVVFTVSSGGSFAVFELATGKRLWNRPLSSVNTPWIAGDYLYVLTSDDTLLCLVKYSGNIRWASKLASYEDEKLRLDPIHWSGPVLADGRLILVGSHGVLQTVDAQSGSLLQAIDIEEGIYPPPVIAGGRLYLVGKNATLYGFE